MHKILSVHITQVWRKVWMTKNIRDQTNNNNKTKKKGLKYKIFLIPLINRFRG